MNANIAVLSGDGIGPEIMRSALAVLSTVNKKFGHSFIAEEGLVGGEAYDQCGEPLPKETLELCRVSDAILFGAVGGPVDEAHKDKWKDVEKKVLLDLRREFDLFANMRPLRVFQPTVDSSPLKREIIEGADILIVRELVSGIYFGAHRTYEKEGEEAAEDVNYYSWSEIERILEVGFMAAQKRRRKVTVVDKANVLDTSRLWRRAARQMADKYVDIETEFMFVDNAAMQLSSAPGSFDVIVTENMFGDILSDLGGALVGSLGLLPSASLNREQFGMYEPVHGSAPDIAGQGIANPTAQIFSLAMMLKYSFGLQEEALAVEKSVMSVWQEGGYTRDLIGEGQEFLTTSEFTKRVCGNLQDII